MSIKLNEVDRKNGIVEFIIETMNVDYHLLNAGATIYRILHKNRNEKKEDVVLYYSDVNQYLKNEDLYIGTTIGRFGGRVTKKTLDHLGLKHKPNIKFPILHSGDGIHNKLFDYRISKKAREVVIEFVAIIEDNFEGSVRQVVKYIIYDTGKLLVEFESTPTHNSLISITNHSYFNLSGNFKDNIQEHKVSANTAYIGILDKHNIPIELRPFKLKEKKIDDFSISDDMQFTARGGVDHPFSTLGHSMPLKLKLESPERVLTIKSSYPSVVLFGQSVPTPKIMCDSAVKKNTKYNGLAIEPQFFPDYYDELSLVKKDETISAWITYEFSLNKLITQ